MTTHVPRFNRATTLAGCFSLTHNFETTSAAEDSSSTIDKLGNLWCAFMHDAPSWPIHGHYTCRVCGRRYSVAWDRQIEVAVLGGVTDTQR
jgi:hypothetical protein